VEYASSAKLQFQSMKRPQLGKLVTRLLQKTEKRIFY
jgi:hypothetical protein